MPNTKSAKKRAKQDEVKALNNRSKKNKMKTEIKKLETLVEEGGDKEQVLAQLNTALKAVDKAAKGNVIHDNTAARKKSNLQKTANKILA